MNKEKINKAIDLLNMQVKNYNSLIERGYLDTAYNQLATIRGGIGVLDILADVKTTYDWGGDSIKALAFFDADGHELARFNYGGRV